MTRVKGTHITDTALRLLFHTVCIDSDSETGRGLVSDVYSGMFAFSGLSFAFDDLDLEEKLKDLSRRIKAGEYEKVMEFKARLRK